MLKALLKGLSSYFLERVVVALSRLGVTNCPEVGKSPGNISSDPARLHVAQHDRADQEGQYAEAPASARINIQKPRIDKYVSAQYLCSVLDLQMTNPQGASNSKVTIPIYQNLQSQGSTKSKPRKRKRNTSSRKGKGTGTTSTWIHPQKLVLLKDVPSFRKGVAVVLRDKKTVGDVLRKVANMKRGVARHLWSSEVTLCDSGPSLSLSTRLQSVAPTYKVCLRLRFQKRTRKRFTRDGQTALESSTRSNCKCAKNSHCRAESGPPPPSSGLKGGGVKRTTSTPNDAPTGKKKSKGSSPTSSPPTASLSSAPRIRKGGIKRTTSTPNDSPDEKKKPRMSSSSSTSFHTLDFSSIPPSSPPTSPEPVSLQPGGCGLVNPMDDEKRKNICYINAALQTLLRIPAFLEGVESHNIQSCEIQRCTMCRLSRLAEQIIYGTKLDVPREFTGENVTDWQPYFRPGEQDDSWSFIRGVFDRLKQEDPGAEVWLNKLFQLNKTCRCNCGRETTSTDLGCGFGVVESRSLEEALQKQLASQAVEGRQCCQNPSDATIYDGEPKILLVQLERSFYTKKILISPNGSQNEFTSHKWQEEVVYPLRLSLGDLTGNHSSLPYRLHAVIDHHGDTVQEGHYTAAVKGDGGWYEYNDAVVTAITSGLGRKDAYILVYVREDNASNEDGDLGNVTDTDDEKDPVDKQPKSKPEHGNVSGEDGGVTRSENGQEPAGNLPRPQWDVIYINGKRRLMCKINNCCKKFPNLSRLKQHVESIHEKKRPYVCTVAGCGKSFARADILKLHVESIHEKKRLHVCAVAGCGKSFPYPSSLKQHVESIHEKKRPYVCTVAQCGKSFPYPSSLKNHVESIHGKERPYVCAVAGCGKSFPYPSSLKQHVESIHEKKRPYVCTVAQCGKSFPYPSSLKNHVESIHGKERPYVCAVAGCGKSFPYPSYLKQHVESVHEKKRPHVCAVAGCGKSFPYPSYLKQHVESIHEKKRPHVCAVAGCGKSFARADILKQHVESVHEKKRPYVCTVAQCGKSFARADTLKQHVESVHEKVRDRRVCSHCGRVYTYRSGLITHHHTHKSATLNSIMNSFLNLFEKFQWKGHGYLGFDDWLAFVALQCLRSDLSILETCDPAFEQAPSRIVWAPACCLQNYNSSNKTEWLDEAGIEPGEEVDSEAIPLNRLIAGRCSFVIGHNEHLHILLREVGQIPCFRGRVSGVTNQCISLMEQVAEELGYDRRNLSHEQWEEIVQKIQQYLDRGYSEFPPEAAAAYQTATMEALRRYDLWDEENGRCVLNDMLGWSAIFAKIHEDVLSNLDPAHRDAIGAVVKAAQFCSLTGASHGGSKVIDHCHRTGVLRGVLSKKINLALGSVEVWADMEKGETHGERAAGILRRAWQVYSRNTSEARLVYGFVREFGAHLLAFTDTIRPYLTWEDNAMLPETTPEYFRNLYLVAASLGMDNEMISQMYREAVELRGLYGALVEEQETDTAIVKALAEKLWRETQGTRRYDLLNEYVKDSGAQELDPEDLAHVYPNDASLLDSSNDASLLDSSNDTSLLDSFDDANDASPADSSNDTSLLDSFDDANDASPADSSNDTSLLDSFDDANDASPADSSNDTSLLDSSNDTSLLDSSNDASPADSSNDTSLLDSSNDASPADSSNDTSLLDSSDDASLERASASLALLPHCLTHDSEGNRINTRDEFARHIETIRTKQPLQEALEALRVSYGKSTKLIALRERLLKTCFPTS
ncbi:hypothetical protein VKT23_004089 [Stygiomarasmius scandens]|uniref:Ubiquitinyl hydrolase 1 n=1 Tax=Marasmiellus scandens TaxID=2682957 RepID=A0ABR1JZJ5_9AGAR